MAQTRGEVSEGVGVIVVRVNDGVGPEFAKQRERHPQVKTCTPWCGVQPDAGGVESPGQEGITSGEDDAVDLTSTGQFACQQVHLPLSPAPFATARHVHDAHGSGHRQPVSAGQRSPWR